MAWLRNSSGNKSYIHHHREELHSAFTNKSYSLREYIHQLLLVVTVPRGVAACHRATSEGCHLDNDDKFKPTSLVQYGCVAHPPRLLRRVTTSWVFIVAFCSSTRLHLALSVRPMRLIVAGASALLLLSLHVHAIRDGTHRRTMKKLTGIAPSPGVDARGYCHPTEQNQPGDCTHGERGWLEVGERSGIRTLEQCAQAST